MNASKLLVVAAAAGGLILAACGGSAASTAQAASSPATQTTAAPAAPAAAKVPLILQSDTVLGSKNLTKAQASETCVRDSQYAHNQEIVWRVRVFDPATGQPMDDSTLSSVVVKLADGTNLNAKYSGHPGTNATDHFWAVSWTVPASYPTGELDYQIAATAKDGRTGSFLPFLVSPSMLQVTSAVQPASTGS